MKKSLGSFAVLATLMAGAALPAYADTNPEVAATPSGTTTTTTAAAVSKGALDNVTLAYWANYNGPSIGNFNSMSPNADGTFTSPQALDTLLFAGYQITPSLNLGPAIEFHYFPVTGQNAHISGQNMHLNDMALRLKNGHLIQSGGFNMSADFYVYAPTDPARSVPNFLTGVRTTEITTYDVPGTKLTLGLYSYLRANDYGAYAASQDLVDIIAAPFASYPISKTVQVTLWNDLIQLQHFRGIAGMQNQPVDFEPGINWDATSFLSVNPYINIYTQSPTLQATYVGLILTGKVL